MQSTQHGRKTTLKRRHQGALSSTISGDVIYRVHIILLTAYIDYEIIGVSRLLHGQVRYYLPLTAEIPRKTGDF